MVALQMRLAALNLQVSTVISKASTSTLPPLSHSFHNSSSLLAKNAKLKSRLRKRNNLQRRQAANEKLKQTAPDPVRGYGPNQERLWLNSTLKSILLDREEIWKGQLPESKGMLPALMDPNDERLGPKGGEFTQVPVASGSGSSTSSESLALPVTSTSTSSIPPTPYLNFALTPSDAALLFEQLPKSAVGVQLDPTLPEATRAKREKEAEPVEANKVEALRRILDLRNTNSRGIRNENTRRIIRRFGQGEGVGRVEVQVAIITMRIHAVADHKLSMPRDDHCKMGLRALIMQRAKLLKYLKGYNLERYVSCLKDIGVEQRAVEGEIVVK